MSMTPGIIPAIGDQVIKAKDNTVRAVNEEAGKFTDQIAGQLSPAPLTEEQKKNTRQEVEGIYGGKEAMMDPQKYAQQKNQEQKHSAGLIEQILGQLIPSHKMKDDRKQKVGLEHKREAEELGQAQNNQQQQEQQKKQQEEAEEKQKKEEEKAKLATTIEAPAGKHTGVSFGRKKSAPRMQTPPSAETRGGKGNRE